jgi:ceramide glucosyltransferase
MMLGILLACALAGTASSTIYLALVIAAAYRFRGRAGACVDGAPARVQWPPVSVLKPLHGLEPKLEDCLESFFTQAYGDFELVFAARNDTDEAWPVVRRLCERHPDVRTTFLYTGDPRYANAKVSALEKMVDAASSSYLVITDSDARVAPDCLTAVVRPLLDPRVGLVTCLYRGVPLDGLCSQLEALGMSVELAAGVLVADMLEGMRFALGPMMVTRKDVLPLVGGLGSLGQYCADDYILGERTHAAGKVVLLSEHVIDHVVVNRSLRASLLHQARWMRSTRFSRPKGHVGTALTFAMPFGLLGLIVGLAEQRVGLALALFGWAVLNRVLLCVVVGWGVVQDRNARQRCWLYPVRDLLGFAIWCSSFFGSGIVWRGERYTLEPGGRMRSMDPRDGRGADLGPEASAPSRGGG